jgi:hypothetical protein
MAAFFNVLHIIISEPMNICCVYNLLALEL